MTNKKIMEIQQSIKKEREKQGISVRKFAEMIGCTSRAISYWDKGDRVMSIEIADKALCTLGISATIGISNKKKEEEK